MNFPNYKNYRWFFTSSGNLVVGGKSASQNDELLQKLKETSKDFTIMHTSTPGSPFTVVLSDKKLSPKEIEETAIFTASFSKAWKLQKKSESVDIFSLSQLFKSKNMKSGTWGVSGKILKKSSQLKLVLAVQENVLRAVPESAVKKSEILLHIQPGKKDKTELVEAIQKALKQTFSHNEILGALPPGGVQYE